MPTYKTSAPPPVNLQAADPQADDPVVFASSYPGLLAAGLTVVPLDPRLPPADRARHLDRVGADLLVTDQPGAGATRTPPARARSSLTTPSYDAAGIPARSAAPGAAQVPRQTRRAFGDSARPHVR